MIAPGGCLKFDFFGAVEIFHISRESGGIAVYQPHPIARRGALRHNAADLDEIGISFF